MFVYVFGVVHYTNIICMFINMSGQC